MHAIAETWALDPEQLRATLTLWREHKLIATDGPDTFRKRLRTGQAKASYPLCVPVASYPLPRRGSKTADPRFPRPTRLAQAAGWRPRPRQP